MGLYERIKGTRLALTYDDDSHFVLTLLSEKVVKWEKIATKPGEEGAASAEPFEVEEIEKGIYFLNWIEQSGCTCSLVLDFVNHKANSYLTYSDHNGRGGRGKVFRKGTFRELAL